MSRREILVAPSVLSANILNLSHDILDCENAGADWHHIDVMDGHFVPNLTFGCSLISALKKISKIPLDVHIMIDNPEQMALSYVDAGADILVFHAEATNHSHRLAQQIKAKGAKVGVALNPGTPIDFAYSLAPFVDLILIMSVNPGFGGQSFIPNTVQKISQLRNWLEKNGLFHSVKIQVDGGINETNVAQVISAGASILVAGTHVYGAPDRRLAIQSLKNVKN
jgi:ribulose-phosphate 3-epimerase